MAINFDGNGDYLKKDSVNIFNDSSYSSTSYSFSFSCWIKPNGRPTQSACSTSICEGGIFEQYSGTSSSQGRLGLYLLSNGKIRQRYHGSYITSNTAHISTSTSTWYHIMGFWEHAERGMYVNGTVSDYTNTNNTGTKTTDHSTSGLNFNIGRAYTGGPGNEYFFDGDIAEVAGWKTKLTEPEITSLSKGFSPLFIRPSELLGYWSLGGSYPDYIDLIQSNTVTAEGDPTVAEHPRIFYPTSPQIGVPSGTVVPNAMHHYRMLRCS